MKWTFVAVLKKSIAVQWCAWHRGVKILGLTNQIFFLQIFSFIIDLFTPERISPDCPFKSNQRFSKISILMHTAELDPTVWCTPGSLTPRYDAPIGAFWEILGHLTPLCDAHRGAWLRGGMHTAESDYQYDKKFLCFFEFLTSTFDRKTSELKNIP